MTEHRHPWARSFERSTGHPLAAAMLIALSGCSVLLNPEARCEVDDDCLADLVCRSGVCVVGSEETDAGVPQESNDPYLLAYFLSSQSVQADSLYLAYSNDGLTWQPLNDNTPVYQLDGIGTGHIRDPFILRKQDGTFVLLATDWTLAESGPEYWSRPSPYLFVADSEDLTEFTNPRRVRVTNLRGPGGSDMHAWAPEAFYDESREQYGIIWSGNDASDVNRIYVSYTSDFESIWNSTPAVFFDPGYSVIDGTLVRWGGRSYLFFKDESDGDGGPTTGSGKDIQVARTASDTLAPGSFVRWDADYLTRGVAQTMRQATEGPYVVKVPGESRWRMCADYFAEVGRFGCWEASSLDAEPSSWRALSPAEYRFPPGAAHASVVRVTPEELNTLIDHYQSSTMSPQRIRSATTEAGVSLYVAHSYFHLITTFLGDTAAGQEPEDFHWRVVPGLADPEDPDLVSFEAVNFPGRYLRVDAANPGRYPTCPNESNRSTEACNDVPVADRDHLAWLDETANTDTFRSEATFRRVDALNGDASMLSLQWHADSTRYLRMLAFQVFVQSIDTSAMAERDSASFAFEPL